MKTSELANQVRDIPLRDVLEHYGFETKPEGTTLRAKTEQHNIVVTGSRWFDNKANVGGGGAIDLVMHIAGMEFSAACRSLADEFRPLAAAQSEVSFPRSLRSPPATAKKSFEELAAIYAVRDDSNWPVARAYLTETRKIDPAIVDELHAVGSIYANDHRPNPSLVFLHREPHGKVRGASLRDTRQKSAFRPCLGNKLTAWFAVGNFANADRVVAVESPIDALSYYSLFANRYEALAIVSCAGSTVPYELMFQACDRRRSFVVALDNDAAGERGWAKAWDDTVDWAGFRLSSECPTYKDWNDDLVMSPANSRGSPPHSGYESPLHKCRVFASGNAGSGNPAPASRRRCRGLVSIRFADSSFVTEDPSHEPEKEQSRDGASQCQAAPDRQSHRQRGQPERSDCPSARDIPRDDSGRCLRARSYA